MQVGYEPYDTIKILCGFHDLPYWIICNVLHEYDITNSLKLIRAHIQNVEAEESNFHIKYKTFPQIRIGNSSVTVKVEHWQRRKIRKPIFCHLQFWLTDMIARAAFTSQFSLASYNK